MAATATIAFRVKPEIKKRADALFARLGMTTSTGMNVLLMQTLDHRGFPFAITVPLEERRARKPSKPAAKPSPEYKPNEGDPAMLVAAEPDPFGDEDWPNAETRAVLEGYLAGTEPLYGPFKTTEEMLDAALAMED